MSLLRALASWVLRDPRMETTVSLGNPFYCLTVIVVRVFSTLSLFCFSLNCSCLFSCHVSLLSPAPSLYFPRHSERQLLGLPKVSSSDRRSSVLSALQHQSLKKVILCKDNTNSSIYSRSDDM